MYFETRNKTKDGKYVEYSLQHPDLDYHKQLEEFNIEELYASLEHICRQYGGIGAILININPVVGVYNKQITSYYGINSDLAADIAAKSREIIPAVRSFRSVPASFDIEIHNTRYYVYLIRGQRDYLGQQILLYIARGVLSYSTISEILFLGFWLIDRVAENPQLRMPDYRKYALTRQEAECLHWMAEGKTTKEISTILGISTSTIDHAAISVSRKLNTINRIHTVAKAIQLGLI